jgi:hypothetical protein
LTLTGAVSVTVKEVEPLTELVGGLTTIGVPGVTPAAGANGVAVTKVAMIVVLPSETLLARPAAVIVATPGTEELQVTEVVRFSVLPFLK